MLGKTNKNVNSREIDVDVSRQHKSKHRRPHPRAVAELWAFFFNKIDPKIKRYQKILRVIQIDFFSKRCNKMSNKIKVIVAALY